MEGQRADTDFGVPPRCPFPSRGVKTPHAAIPLFKAALLVTLFLAAANMPQARAQPFTSPPPFAVANPSGPDKCASCHGWRQADLSPRTLKKPHDTLMFTHWPQPGPWCDHCHKPTEPRRLILHHDQTVDFKDAHLLCGQCHGAKVRDWQFGAHGKRIGNWQGPRQIQPCSACHNPHQPKTRPLVPSSPPAQPGTIRPWKPVMPPTQPQARQP